MSLYAGDTGQALPITLTTSQAADVARFVIRYRPTSSGAVVTWDLTPSSSTASTVSFVRVLQTGDNASANTIADVTGLSFSVTGGAGEIYWFNFIIPYTSALVPDAEGCK